MSTFNAIFTERRYDPQDIHIVHQGNFFQPAGAMPTGGWPCVIYTTFGGFAGSSVGVTITETNRLVWDLLENGYAVFLIYLPPSRSDVNPALPDKSHASFNPNAGEWGPAYPRANGAIPLHFGTVGGSWPGTNPQQVPAPKPWVNPDWVSAEKAACYAIQHVRYHSQGGTAELPVNGDKIGVWGQSAGAISFAFPALMPDLAGELGMTDPQSMVSTRVNAAMLLQVIVHPAIRDEDVPGIALGAARHMSADDPPDFDEPAAKISDVGFPILAYFRGAIVYAHPTQGQNPQIHVENQALPIWTGSGEKSSDEFLAIPNRYVATPFVMAVETATHPISSQYMLKSLLPEKTRFVALSMDGIDPMATTTGGAVAGHDAYVDGTDQDAMDAEQLSWWQQEMNLNVGPLPIPAEEQVMRLVEARLLTISVDNGYRTDIEGVRRWSPLPEEPVSPGIYIARAGSTPSESGKQLSETDTRTLRLVLILRRVSFENTDLLLSEFIADVIKALYADVQLGGNVLNLDVGAIAPSLAPDDEQQIEAEAEIEVDITYRVAWSNQFALHPPAASS